jgi:hypothetical protein
LPSAHSRASELSVLSKTVNTVNVQDSKIPRKIRKAVKNFKTFHRIMEARRVSMGAAVQRTPRRLPKAIKVIRRIALQNTHKSREIPKVIKVIVLFVHREHLQFS